MGKSTASFVWVQFLDHHVTAYRTSCDKCGGEIGGARISCLTCQVKKPFSTVDFCAEPGCISVRVFNDELFRPHQPTHDLVKLRRVVHLRQFGKTYRDAKEALKHARTFFASDEPKELVSPKSLVSSKSLMSSKALMSAVGGSDSGFEDALDADLDTRAGPRCANCNNAVTQPCWYCVQCESTYNLRHSLRPLADRVMTRLRSKLHLLRMRL